MRECDEIELSGSTPRVRIGEDFFYAYQVRISKEGIFADIIRPDETVKLKSKEGKTP